MSWTNTFTGDPVSPAQASYLALTFSVDQTLVWPNSQASSADVFADVIELTAGGPGLKVNLPAADQGAPGTLSVLNNLGADTITIVDAGGNTIVSLVSGTSWVVYLADNSSVVGVWRTFQLGASISVAAAGALAGAGLKAISSTLNQSMPVTSFADTPHASTSADRGALLNWTGGLGTLDLPDPAVVGSDWYLQVRNSGSGNLTVAPAAGLIDAAANKIYGPGTSSFIVCDGSNYYTVGYGSGSSGSAGFDFVEIDVSGAGTYNLSGVNLNRIAYRFKGTLTGDRTIIVPATTQQYWVANICTGAFNLYVRTAAQTLPGIQVLINNQIILYCDGANVINAESSTVSFPIVVAQGGTGAVTAAAALTNLGAAGTALANTFSLTQRISNTAPEFELNESDGAADNRLWSVRVNGEQLKYTAWNDAKGVGTDFITVDRTGTVVDSVAFAATTVTVNGVSVRNASLFNTGTLANSVLDRTSTTGLEPGYLDSPVNSQSANYTLVMTDRGKVILHPNGAGGFDNFTIPTNASVPFPVGTTITIINEDPNTLGILISTDTLRLANSTSTGSRVLAQNGMATIVKIAATTWMISGVGLT